MAYPRKHSLKQYDFISLLLYFFLIFIGNLLMYSLDSVHADLGKQTFYFKKNLLWTGVVLIFFFFIYKFSVKKVKEWGSLIYLFGLILLIGLFFFGKEISGAKSWYRLGSLGIQPSEFMKLATALGLAKLISERSFDLKKITDIFKALILIALPVMLIILQPDLGTVLIFSAFILVLYREGLNGWYIFPVVWLSLLFIFTILYGKLSVVIFLTFITVIAVAFIYWKTKRYRWNYISIFLAGFVISSGFVFLSSFIYQDVLKPHQQKRIALLLGKISDPKGVGYHLHQSLIAISNGGKNGQGFTEGVQLRGNYIPEQHTDYIFTALAEQFGFTGSIVFILIYVLFIVRIYYLAERQKQTFSRVVGYSLASLLAIHFFINVLMILGLFPIVGIPLIFISYGGSSLLFFSLLFFLFLKMDATRVEEL